MRPILLGAALACAGSTPAVTGAAPAVCARTEVPMKADPELTGVLLQSENIDREGERTGYRLFEDGRFERRRAGGPWEPKEPLGEDAMKGVREAIDAAKLTAGRYFASQSPSDATRRELQVRVNGALVKLEIGDGCTVEGEQRLATAIAPLIH